MKRLAILPLLVLAACESPQPPAACGPIPQVTVNAGETAAATACFNDPNGDALVYSATSSNPGVATVSMSGTAITIAAIAPGGASVTVTASDPGGLEAQQILQVLVPNRAPQPRGTMPSLTVPVGRTEPVDASSYFAEPDGETLAYSATSSNPAVATVSVSGSVVSVAAVAKGGAVVIVTATDPGGLAATQSFQVTVPNRAPVAGDPIADIEVFVGDAAEVDASGHFSDPDGDPLAYGATTSDPAVAAVSVWGSTVTVEAVSQGRATVTVTATDPEELAATQTFRVTVPNRAPVAGDPIADIEVFVGDAAEVDASGHFSDPDGDPLAYGATTSDPAVAAVSVSGSTVSVEALSQGRATVTVTATDPGALAATQTFRVTVPNRAPQPVGTIEDREVAADATTEVDVAAYFTDPDGDLTYAASSSRTHRVGVSVSGSVLTVTGVAKGSATVAVTATDPEGLAATQTFRVTVPNRAPVAGDPVPDIDVAVDSSAVVDLAEHFSDPDGDRLEYSARSSSTATARVTVSGSVVAVRARAKGIATVTVTARDPEGLSATQTFRVTVPNRAPVAGDPIPDIDVAVDSSAVVDLAEHFSDPDGDPLRYSARSSDAGVARVSVSGSTVRIRGVGAGSATITITARDPDGLTATQVADAIVEQPNRAPRAVGSIPAVNLAIGGTATIDASDYFTDPDGDALTFTARSSDAGVARVSVSGPTVRIRGVGAGSATITITARDPGGLTATQRASVTVHRGDREVLVALYNATGGPNWRDNTNWLTDKPLGEWYGVDTDASGRVVRLDLAGEWDSDDGEYVSHGLSGPIPPELGDLANLESLYLWGNELTGSIPPQLGNLSNLDTLVVYANSLTGAIPPELGDLSNLVLLNLSSNPLTGTIPPELGNLSNLEVLWLNGNSLLTGTIPPELGNLRNLRLLALRYSSLTGTIPPELGDLRNLTFLSLSANRLTGSIPAELGDLSNLEYLYLQGNDLTGSIPAELGDLSNLTRLWVENNELTGPIPNSFLTLNNLEWLDFYGNDGLCAPNTAAFTRWLNQIELWNGPRCESFDFDIYSTGAVSSTVLSRLEEARDEWELVLKDTELSDIRVNRTLRCLGISGYVGTVDDHVLFAHVDSIDGEGGILAVATYCYRRTSDGSPMLSATWIDEDDIEELADEDALVPVAFHEMGHALGFPGYWFYNDLVDTLDADDPHFEGELAIEAFDDAGGDDYDGEKVPIQLRVYGHWRESVFGDEIMSPTVRVGTDKLPVSAITLQSFADVGYEVDVSRADDYELPGTAKRPGGEAVFDLGNDVVWGPVVVLDTDGRVVRVIPPPRGAVGPSLPRRDVRIEPRRPPGPGSAASDSVRPPPPRPEELDLIKKPRRPPGSGNTPPGSGSGSG